MSKPNGFEGIDLSIVKLPPRTERKVNPEYRKRLESGMPAVRFFKPLIVFAHEDHFEIQNGDLRYQILRANRVKTIPCIPHIRN